MTSINEKHSRMAVCSECSGKGDLISERLEERICSGSAEPASTSRERVGMNGYKDDGHVTLPLSKECALDLGMVCDSGLWERYSTLQQYRTVKAKE